MLLLYFRNASLFVALFFLVCSAQAQVRYVTDDFEIMMRTGPSVQNKIVSPLRSGTKLEILREDAGNGHSLVQTSKGETGYVLTRFLSKSRAARSRLKVVQEQLSTLRSKPSELQALLATSQDENRELIQLNTELTSRLKIVSDELALIKNVSADAVAISERNDKLEKEARQLLLELDEMRIQKESYQDQKDLQYFTYGVGAILLGLFFGWVLSIARRPRRNSWGS